MRRPALSLLLLSALTFGLALGRPAVTDSDEAYYAEAAREMVESGDWLTPRFNYADRWEKPALYYWLTAGLYALAGPSPGAARAWAALAGLGLVLLTAAVGRRADGARTGWLAGAIVASCYGYFAMARAALPDLPLALAVTATLWAAWRAADAEAPRARWAWWLAAGAAAGAGFLLKGPVAVVVPGVVALPVWWIERGRLRVRGVEIAAAAAVAALVGLPWYVAMVAEHGLPYLQSFFVGDNLARFATDRFNAPRPPWFYAPIVLGGLMPWTAYLLLAPAPPLAALLRRRIRLTSLDWRLVLWAAMPLAFFTLSIGKQPRYILPVLPPLAVLLARALVRRIDEAAAGDRGAVARLRAATWLTAGLLGAAATVLVRARVLVPDAPPAVAWFAAALPAAGALVLAAVALRGAWQALPRTVPPAAAGLLLAVLFGVLAPPGDEPVERVARLVAASRTAGEPVGTFGVFTRNLVFYTGVPQVPIFDREQAVTFLRAPGRVLLALDAGDLAALERLAGVPVRRLGETRYLNTAALRLDMLLWPLPGQDLATVVLVTNR